MHARTSDNLVRVRFSSKKSIQASDTTECSLERQKIFSYKLVLSDINKFAKYKAERAGCRWADRLTCSACAVDAVHVLARKESSDRIGGGKGKGVMPEKGHRTSLRIKLVFNSLGRK